MHLTGLRVAAVCSPCDTGVVAPRFSAACHACLFVSETTCERGNRFLDRRFVVPIDAEFPALIP